MPAGNFVSAALPSLSTQFKNTIGFVDPEYINNETLNAFLQDVANKFLTSIGVVIEKLPNKKKNGLNWKKVRKEVVKKGRMTTELVDEYVNKHLMKFHSYEFLNDVEFIIDSAGFSIQQKDYFELEEIPQFIELYHQEFLNKHHDKFNYAFSLDIAPGASNCPFNYEQMKKLAHKSYKIASELPEHVRKKILYVHHFRTPMIRKAYTDLLENYAHEFFNFSTGGLVSFGRSGRIPPYVLYVIPLLDILDVCMKKGIKSFRFHVLGGSEWKEILGHVFFTRHIKELFDIDVEITYDSTTIFKTLCLGRYTFYPDYENRAIKKITIRGDQLHLRHESNRNKTKKDMITELFNDAVQKYGMKGLDSEVLFYEDTGIHKHKKTTKDALNNDLLFLGDEEKLLRTGSLSRLVYTYGMLQILHLFKLVETWCEEIADSVYEKHIDKDLNLDREGMSEEIEKAMIMLNGGKSVSRTIDIRTDSIANSLQLLTDFKRNPKETREFCNTIINDYMCGDECEDFDIPSIISFE